MIIHSYIMLYYIYIYVCMCTNVPVNSDNEIYVCIYIHTIVRNQSLSAPLRCFPVLHEEDLGKAATAQQAHLATGKPLGSREYHRCFVPKMGQCFNYYVHIYIYTVCIYRLWPIYIYCVYIYTV